MDTDAQNSEITTQAPKKTVGRPFQKGDKRINAGGRPRLDTALVEACQRLTPKLVKRLGEIALAPSSRPSDATKAAQVILAYAHGTPRQSIDVDMQATVETVDRTKIEAVLAKLPDDVLAQLDNE